ncbi:hypothetical protein GQ43DRAFT_199529 [Delitschia confertaspora ATCC 74209]|uniref:Uncharacterized protein n=1 Tax=Delitschia confertaspora ATCC 74209 TaxID=1513339 RepID=A0A9P4JDT9_9PLEO|nr:hypothetical protein GQ43DRAFT_199529 [Delitschia confertaspora ATCC 74209]
MAMRLRAIHRKGFANASVALWTLSSCLASSRIWKVTFTVLLYRRRCVYSYFKSPLFMHHKCSRYDKSSSFRISTSSSPSTALSSMSSFHCSSYYNGSYRSSEGPFCSQPVFNPQSQAISKYTFLQDPSSFVSSLYRYSSFVRAIQMYYITNPLYLACRTTPKVGSLVSIPD